MHYKDSTIGRRIARRMVINQVGTLQDYVNLLCSHLKNFEQFSATFLSAYKFLS